MFFKNLTALTFKEKIPFTPADMESKFAKDEFRDCGDLELSSMGFSQALGLDSGFCLEVGDAWFFSVKRQEKVMPASSIEKLVRDQVKLIESHGETVGRKRRKDIKEKVIDSILPNALVKESVVHGYVDAKLGMLFLDTASAGLADDICSFIRRSVDGLPASQEVYIKAASVFTWWLSRAGVEGALPDFIELLDSAEFSDDEGSKTTVKMTQLDSDEVAEILAGGKVPRKIRVLFRDALQVTLSDCSVFRRLDFADDVISHDECDDVHSMTVADSEIMVGIIRDFIENVRPAISGLKPDQ